MTLVMALVQPQIIGGDMTQLPAVSLAAVPGRRLQTIEIAKKIEKKGFPGIFGPS